ncbi:aldo/keto reductase [Saccharopolyspora sp. NPDC003752]
MTQPTTSSRPVEHSGTFRIGDELAVRQLGFGAMRIVGPGIWGPPEDRDNSIEVLRRSADLGVNLIDTAEAYGPDVSEELIREALHPYPEELVIATKGGIHRPSVRQLTPNGSPEFLRQGVEGSLRKLGVETIDVYQLHRIDPQIPVEESLGALKELRDEGKIRHIGLSEVSVEEIERARRVVEIATVQNRYNVADREHDKVVDHCEREGIGFIPWFPLATGSLARPGGPLEAIARRTGATPSQLALAWLLHRSPAMLPIPGTASLEHLAENCAAAVLRLSEEDLSALDNIA